MDESKLSAGEFKATCLKLMDEVAATGREIIITKRGKPVAKLVPVAPLSSRSIFGALADTVEILGDIVSPSGIDDLESTLRKWDRLHEVSPACATQRTAAKPTPARRK